MPPSCASTAAKTASIPALVAASAADTVFWYNGEDSAEARKSVTAKIDDGTTINYGAQANEAGLVRLVQTLAAMAEQHRLKSVGFREYAEAGGLLGFGVNFPDVWRRGATFVDRIFKGAKPGDLPIEQPVKYDTVVNLRTARALKVTISPKVLLKADTVIDR